MPWQWKQLQLGVLICTKNLENNPSNLSVLFLCSQLGVWDTAGVERFRTITNNYYRGSHAAIFVYSVDEPSSLHYLGHWIRDLEEYSPNAIKILVGNKKDLNSQISNETIEMFNNANDCKLNMLMSAKTGEGIQDAFNAIAKLLVQKGIDKDSSNKGLELEAPQPMVRQWKNGCCSWY